MLCFQCPQLVYNELHIDISNVIQLNDLFETRTNDTQHDHMQSTLRLESNGLVYLSVSLIWYTIIWYDMIWYDKGVR